MSESECNSYFVFSAHFYEHFKTGWLFYLTAEEDIQNIFQFSSCFFSWEILESQALNLNLPSAAAAWKNLVAADQQNNLHDSGSGGVKTSLEVQYF